MSSVGFNVHVDKENVTYGPGINKGGPLKQFAPRDINKGKIFATPRKALVDVNQEPINITASRNPEKNKLGSSSAGLKDGSFLTQKPSSVIQHGVENVPAWGNNKTQDSRKPFSVQKKEADISQEADHLSTNNKPNVGTKKRKSPPEPTANFEEVDCESESIFPRSERLSSYVDKLMTWRVPCLFAPPPDSESDSSDLEDLLQHDDIFLDMPPFSPLVPEFSDADLDKLMEDFPPPKPDCEHFRNVAYQDLGY